MNEIKYTTDGKKVVVVGSLNSQEKIVQEVFICNDVELPSGENFVVKSLHDAPVRSWKDIEGERIQKQIEIIRKEEKDLQDALYKKRKRMRELGDTLTTQINWMASFVKNINETSFDRLKMFVSGKANFLVLTKYEIQIVDFTEFMSNEYGMKLLSLFGKDDGSMSFAVGRYSDGSGSWNDNIAIPAETYEEAVKIAQEELTKQITKNGKVYSSDIKSATKHGLIIDQKYLDEYNNEQRIQIQKRIDELSKEIDKRQIELSSI